MSKLEEAESEPVTREERIARRRAALNARVESRKTGAEDGRASKLQEEKVLGKGEQQIAASRHKLDQLKTVGTEDVTKFRIETDIAENERRIAEEGQREGRLEKKADEAASSNKRNAAVQMKWQALYEKRVPQDLLKEVTAQKEACEKIVQSKDRLIAEFHEELRQKDEEYVMALKKQAEDIDRLIATMHQQTKALISAYEQELEDIEAAFMQERAELLDSNQAEINALIDQRRTKELQNRKAREDKVEEEQSKLDLIHENYAEQYNILKMKLQKEIQGLEQQLEEMRALYQLNAEKLEYNLRVLSERVKENEKAIQHHKRKLARLQDVLSGLITKYADTDKKFQQENNILSEQYRRITEQYKDLQLKFQYFEQADTEKYRQIWAMNEREAMELVDTCVKADRVIFEQQLGADWKMPPLNFWSDGEYTEDKEKLADEGGSDGEEEKELSEDAQRMLEMLASQCSFLVEDRVRKVIDKLEQEARVPKKIESILKALAVESHADINKMLQFFQPAADGDAPEEPRELIDPQDAITALRSFIEHQTKIATLQPTKKSQGLTAEERLKDKRRREEREFWRRMANVIPERSYRVWGAFERALEKYIVLLQDRSRLIEETDSIRHQNDELRSLLNQYMSAKVNEELFSPPQLMVANPQGTKKV